MTTLINLKLMLISLPISPFFIAVF